MAWSGEDQNSLHINGGSIVKIAGANIGFVGGLEATATPIAVETTKGTATPGYDLTLKGDLLSNTAANWTMATSNRYVSEIQLYGADDMATLTNVFVKWTLTQKFDGKSGSKIAFEAKLPGANITKTQSFFTNAS